LINSFGKILKRNKDILFYSVTERIFFFFFFLIIARIFSKDSYGEIITSFAYANVLVMLFDFGLPALLQKNLSSDRHSSNEQPLYSSLIYIFAFPLYLLICYVSKIILNLNTSPDVYLLVVSSVYIFSFANLFNKALAGLNEYAYPLKSLLLSRVICLLIIAMLLLMKAISLKFLFLLLLLSAMLQLAILYLFFKKNKLLEYKGKFIFSRIPALLKISVPLGIAVLFNFLYDKIDILLISKINGFEKVAEYNIGYGIYRSSFLLFAFLFVSGLTRVSFLARRKSAVKLFMRRYLLILIPLSLIICTLMFIFSEIIIEFFYTNKFANSAVVLKILSVAVIGTSLNNLTGIILTGAGLFKTNMYITISGVFLNIILNLIFLPEFGIIAASVITVITEFYIFSCGYFYVNKFLKS